MKTLCLIIMLGLSGVVVLTIAEAQRLRPLTLAKIEALVKNGTDDEDIARAVRQRGLDSPPTTKQVEKLRRLAGPQTIEAVEALLPKLSTPKPTPVHRPMPTPTPSQLPQIEKDAIAAFDEFMNARFRKYGESLSYARYDIKYWAHPPSYSGTVIWEIKNLKWKVEGNVAGEIGQMNGEEWSGIGSFSGDRSKRYLFFTQSPEYESYKDGTTEYEGMMEYEYQVLISKRKGMEWKIDDPKEDPQSRLMGRYSVLHSAQQPTDSEIEKALKLSVNRKLNEFVHPFYADPQKYLNR